MTGDPTMTWAESPTQRLQMGETSCRRCGHPGSQLEEFSTMLYEHRTHIRKGVPHTWPQRHTCKPDADACPICADCEDC